MTSKYCNVCRLNKPITDFCKNRRRDDGLQTQCRECHKIAKHQYENGSIGRIRRLAWKRAWRQTSKGKIATARQNHIRRLKTDAVWRLTDAEWHYILQLFENKCIYCQKVAKLTIDHDMPVSAGGDTSKYNCVPACSSCNSKKHTKLLWIDFTPSNFNWDGFYRWKAFCFGRGAYQIKELV